MAGAGVSQSRRLTRSSTEGAELRSRRAFGDVSNQNPVNGNDKSKKPRRSRRLSGEAAVASEKKPLVAATAPQEDNTVVRRRSSRLSLNAEKKPNLKDPPPLQSEGGKSEADKKKEPTKSEKEKRPTGKSSALRTSKQTYTKSRRASRGPKRSRPVDLIEPEPPRKSLRRSSRGKGKNLSLPQGTTICNNLCPDILTNSDHGLQRHPFDSSKYTEGVALYDQENKHDALKVSNYVTDIFQRLYNSEAETRPTPYMDGQPELNAMMRSILIDWIVEVHMKFRLLPETLYLSVNIIDRYLCLAEVPRKKLQLVGVTSLLLACKYEEIYPPEVKDCVYITDRAYTRQDVLDMEAHIVKTLKFHLTVATGYPFLLRFLHISKASTTIKNLANFYMERMLQEYGTLSYRPSVVAAASVSLAMNNPDTLDWEDHSLALGVPQIILRYTGFSVEDIKEVADLMETKVSENNTTNSRRSLVAVRKKYESDRYDNVSTTFTPPLASHLGTS